MKLTRDQRKLLIAWAAEGLELWEINERAAKCDPPFEVEWHQLKHVRKVSKTRISELRKRFREEATCEGVANSFARIRAKARRIGLLEQIRIERGQDVNIQEVPGGKTGLLVREYKGHSDLPVYKIDTGLLKEMRDLEKEIAIELGQWTEKKELTGAGGGALLDPLVAALEKAYGNSKQQPTATD